MTFAAQRQPIVVKYQDQDGNVQMRLVKDSKWKRLDARDSSDCGENSSSDEQSSDVNAHLHEYARRDGPHDSSEDVNEKYNISDEEDFQRGEVHNESDEDEERGSSEKSSHHPYAHDYLGSESDSNSNENHHDKKESSEEKPERHEKRQKHVQVERREKPSKKSKKIVYVYKQPPIVVNPKPTNVYIKSKPIYVQPPPLIVHHPEPKPCNPIIKYQPPNIRLKPVIVKISKPKKTTTTTTPCPKTTKKACRKCKRKPTKKCGRCSRRKQSKSQRPKDVTVYYNQPHYRSSEPAQYVQYKNVKCSDGVLT